jgi:hypothetical protein
VPWKLDGGSQAGPEEPRTRTEKWFFSRPGERQTFPGPENLAKAMAGVTDQMTEPANGYKGWFRFGPHGDLVGRRTTGVGLVPAQVSGQLQLAAGAGSRPAVAVALNGVIAGLSDTYREQRDAQGSQPVGPPDKFSAMVLDTLFKAGGNKLELFVIDDSGGRVRFRPLTVS